MKNHKITFLTTGLILITSQAFGQVDFLGVEEKTEATENQIIYLNEEEALAAQKAQKEKRAQDSAADLLTQQPNILTLRQNEQKLLEEGKEQRRLIKQKIEEHKKAAAEAAEIEGTSAQQVEPVDNWLEAPKMMTEEEKEQKREQIRLEKLRAQLEPAPLGLYWDASIEDLKDLGFEFRAAERKDYQNVYIVDNAQQQNNTFKQVTAVFGTENHLWCIFAEGNPMEDDAQASKILKIYQQYYNALEKKYGKAKQYFMPYTYEVELVEGEGQEKKVTRETRTNPLGGPDFLKELQEGKAVLYATFENGIIGVTLGVSVDGDGKSYISVDYKNLKIMRQEQDAKLNRLIEDI